MQARLTKNKISEINQLLIENNLSQVDIAKLFGVNKSTINKIAIKKTYNPNKIKRTPIINSYIDELKYQNIKLEKQIDEMKNQLDTMKSETETIIDQISRKLKTLTNTVNSILEGND